MDNALNITEVSNDDFDLRIDQIFYILDLPPKYVGQQYQSLYMDHYSYPEVSEIHKEEFDVLDNIKLIRIANLFNIALHDDESPTIMVRYSPETNNYKMWLVTTEDEDDSETVFVSKNILNKYIRTFHNYFADEFLGKTPPFVGGDSKNIKG